MFFAGLLECLAQPGITGNPTGQCNATVPLAACSPNGFLNQYLHNGRLNTGTKIRQRGIVFRQSWMFLQEITNRSFQPAEAEIMIILIQHRPGKCEGLRVTLGGEPAYDRATGIAKPQQFCAFIKTFAGGIVLCAANNGVLKRMIHLRQEGVAAADHQ